VILPTIAFAVKRWQENKSFEEMLIPKGALAPASMKNEI
jgi:hypothetical protein